MAIASAVWEPRGAQGTALKDELEELHYFKKKERWGSRRWSFWASQFFCDLSKVDCSSVRKNIHYFVVVVVCLFVFYCWVAFCQVSELNHPPAGLERRCPKGGDIQGPGLMWCHTVPSGEGAALVTLELKRPQSPAVAASGFTKVSCEGCWVKMVWWLAPAAWTNMEMVIKMFVCKLGPAVIHSSYPEQACLYTSQPSSQRGPVETQMYSIYHHVSDCSDIHVFLCLLIHALQLVDLNIFLWHLGNNGARWPRRSLWNAVWYDMHKSEPIHSSTWSLACVDMASVAKKKNRDK